MHQKHHGLCQVATITITFHSFSMSTTIILLNVLNKLQLHHFNYICVMLDKLFIKQNVYINYMVCVLLNLDILYIIHKYVMDLVMFVYFVES